MCVVVGGGPQGLLEVLNFACRARGDGDPQVFELLVEAISASVTEEFQRRSDAVNRGSDSGGGCSGGLELLFFF